MSSVSVPLLGDSFTSSEVPPEIRVAFKRIMKEIGPGFGFQGLAVDGITLELVSDTWDHLKGSFAGPEDSPYAGGTFFVDIKIPQTYPFAPPKIKFITPIWHPNVSPETGEMCHDFLRDWRAALHVRQLLLFVQSLLSNPELESSITLAAARQHVEARNTFYMTANHWTVVYAGGEKKQVFHSLNAQVNNLVKNVKTSPKTALIALSSNKWSSKDAAQALSRPVTPPPLPPALAHPSPPNLTSSLPNDNTGIITPIARRDQQVQTIETDLGTGERENGNFDDNYSSDSSDDEGDEHEDEDMFAIRLAAANSDSEDEWG